jgi:S1-C subfamily serine protease
VTQIDRDGPAHVAGINGSVRDQFGELSGGDIITAIDGKPITTADEFNAYIDENKYVNDNATLTLYKNGTKQLPLNVTLRGDPNHF